MFIDTTAWVINQDLPATFSVKSRHPKYTEMFPYWQKCRDARKGAKAIKDGPNCETYLPRLDSQVILDNENGKSTPQKNREYKNYKSRGIWYGAVGQTVEAFSGIIYEKPVKLKGKKSELPKDFEENDIIKYASQEDESFTAFMRSCTDEILTVNRVGILEDYPVQKSPDGSIIEMSVAEAEKKKVYSYSIMYKTESIVNWGTTVHKGRKLESFYVLEETWYDYSDSITDPTERLRWRILILDIYEQREVDGELVTVMLDTPVYKQVTVVEDKAGIKITDIQTPLINGKPFDYIPFWTLSAYGNQLDIVREPEIIDLVEMNIGHFRNSADYENELHYVSIKTVILPGYPVDDPNYGPPVLGGALITPDGTSQPSILEATSVSGLANEMKAKEEKMAILGAQMLANKGRYIQSAKTSEIENQGQSGILSSLAGTLEEFFSVILSLKLKWAGLGEEGALVILNKEYMKNSMAPEQIKDLVAAVQAGKMSFKTFYYNISKLDMYPDGWTEEDEIKALDSEGLGMASQDILTALDTANKRIAALEGKKAEPVKDKGAAA